MKLPKKPIAVAVPANRAALTPARAVETRSSLELGGVCLV